MTAPGPDIVDPTWTRAQALADLQACTDLASVVAVANRALGAQRQAWGDTLEEAANAAHLWSLASFPVAAAPTLSLHSRHGVLEGVKGPALVASALDMAKALASGLLQPGLDARARDRFLNRTFPEAALAIGVQHGVFNAQLPTREAPVYTSLVLGTDLEIAGATPMATSALAQARAPSWDHLQALLAAPDPSPPESVAHGTIPRPGDVPTMIDGLAIPETDSNAAPFEALVREGGFSHVSAGPAGGLAQAANAAGQTLGAVRELARMTGLSSTAVGLDGLTLTVNTGFNEDRLEAYYNAGTRRIAMGARCEHLGHEWVHALEHYIERAQDPELTHALERLRQRLNTLTPDTERLQAVEPQLQVERAHLTHTVTEHLRTHGTFLTRLAARHGYLPTAVRTALNHALRDHAPADTAERLGQALAANTARGKPLLAQVFLEDMVGKTTFEAQRAALLHHGLRQGRSFFDTASRDADLGQKRSYWSSLQELLARASEAFFTQSQNPALASAYDADPLRPLGQERVQCAQAFEQFFAEIGPRLKVLASAAMPAGTLVAAEAVVVASSSTTEPASSAASPVLMDLLAARRQARGHAPEAARSNAMTAEEAGIGDATTVSAHRAWKR